ncbi:MAG TPA: hypothetical protein VLZ89_00465 [Anaerolineales bacterium]|nr:hypothetical protein [Anaerolineales bacterium]
MNPQYFLALAVLIIMGWFAVGIIYNLRRGDAVLKWMQSGLPRIGEKTTFRWLGTSVAELVIARAKPPFRRLETLLVMKPRDVFWMTIMAAVQKRDDILIFRAQLSSAPFLDLELADPKTWSGHSALQNARQRGWDSRPYHDLQLMAPKGLIELAASTVDRLSGPMQELAPRYARLSLRKAMPNLEIHIPFPDYKKADSTNHFEALRNLAQAILEPS